jgi:glycine cleavage system H protein
MRYTPDHEWVLVIAGGTVRVGITDYAQTQLGDIVHVELPPVGESVALGDPIGEVESTKSVSEVFAPVAGKIVARNDTLDDSPELVNSDPYGKGWMLELELAEPSAIDSLMGAEDYGRLLEEEA